MNIDEMPAGREMDVMVAKLVFGMDCPPFEPVPIGTVSRAKYEEYEEQGRPRRGIWLAHFKWPFQENDPPRQDPYHFSTDIADAWTVVERLADWEFILQWNLTGRAANNWVAHFSRELFMDDFSSEATAETVPLAICRAALKAVKVQ